LSLSEINLVSNTVVFAIVLGSMGLRIRGKYLWHTITMIIAVAYTLVLFFAFGLPSLFDTNYNSIFTASNLHTAAFGLHAFFGIATLACALWLIALWRPKSTNFPTKSKPIAQAVTILWASAYAVGIAVFIIFNTTLIG
jgi:uncharacterized membrane protein YozB (DUF420 family)